MPGGGRRREDRPEGDPHLGHQPAGSGVTGGGQFQGEKLLDAEICLFRNGISEERIRKGGLPQQFDKGGGKIRPVPVQGAGADGGLRVFRVPGIVGHGKAAGNISRPDVGGKLCLPAVGGAVPGGDQLIVTGQHETGGILHCLKGFWAVPGDPAEYLVAGGIHHVPAGGGIQMAQGISPGADRLGFQGFLREAVAHLIGNHPLQIGFQGKGQDGHDGVVLDGKGKISGIETVLQVKSDAGCRSTGMLPQEGSAFAQQEGDAAGEEDQLLILQADGGFCAV